MCEIPEALIILYFQLKYFENCGMNANFLKKIMDFDKLVMNNRKAKSFYFVGMPHIITSQVPN